MARTPTTTTGDCSVYVIQRDSVVTWMAFKDATKAEIVALERVLARVRDGEDRPHALCIAIVPTATAYDVVRASARGGRPCELVDVAGKIEHPVWANIFWIRI